MDEPRACSTERSQSEGEKQVSYINTYIYIETRRMVLMNIFAGQE